jgi:transcriptional regulator with XRE-family HTH domain
MPRDHQNFFLEFGQRLARLRTERGLTQIQVADALGISQQQLLSFEKGRRRIPASLLPTLAALLDVSVDDLLGLTSPKTKRGPSSKLEIQLEMLKRLPRSKQRFVSQMLEAVLQKTGS